LYCQVYVKLDLIFLLFIIPIYIILYSNKGYHYLIFSYFSKIPIKYQFACYNNYFLVFLKFFIVFIIYLKLTFQVLKFTLIFPVINYSFIIIAISYKYFIILLCLLYLIWLLILFKFKFVNQLIKSIIFIILC
jgi:hypothetical protein